MSKLSEYEMDYTALEELHRVRVNFRSQICAASKDQSEDVLNELRADGMFDFSEFFFMIEAMGLNAPDDISILAELHNRRIQNILENTDALRARKFNKERLLSAIFTSDTRPRLEEIWRNSPGSLDQSNLARFLLPQMSVETSRKIILASHSAGFLMRHKTAYGSIVVRSTGIMEAVFGRNIRRMRQSIAALKDII